jgi:hypothetical protein
MDGSARTSQETQRRDSDPVTRARGPEISLRDRAASSGYTSLAVCVAAGLCMLCAPAARAASGFGEVTRFGDRAEQGKTTAGAAAKGTIGGPRAGTDGEEAPNYAIGVDSAESNSVFVLDEPVVAKLKENHAAELFTIERHFRIQKFSSSGSFEASSRTLSTVTAEVEEEEPITELEAFSNIAVNTATGVLYVLQEEPRSGERAKDAEAPAAYRLYAFKTAPSGSELVPAAGANSEGVLAGPAALAAESEETAGALLEPRGITVDPKTGEVIILGHVDTAGTPYDASPDDRDALERVSAKGVVGARYIDESNYFRAHAAAGTQPGSPVVLPGEPERVLVRFEGLAEVPYDFASAAAPTQVSGVIPAKVRAVLAEAAEDEAGGALALSPEGNL